MSNPHDPAVRAARDLLRMRPGSADPATVGQRILEPEFIRQVVQRVEARTQLDRSLRQSLQTAPPRVAAGPRTSGPRPPAPPRAVRAGEASDLLDALLKIPSVANALRALKTTATAKVGRDLGRLSPGAKAAVISQTALIGGGVLAGALASKPGRQQLYDLVQDRDIGLSVPGVPGLGVELKTGKEHRVMFTLDLAEFVTFLK